jgi:hypothetical protein
MFELDVRENGLKTRARLPSLCALTTPHIPNPPTAVVIRSVSPRGGSSLQPTACTTPPDERASLDQIQLEEAPKVVALPRTSWRNRKTWLAVAGAGIVALVGIGVAVMHHKSDLKPQIVSGRAAPKLTSTGKPQRWWQSDVTVTVDGSLASVWPDATAGVESAFDAWRKANGKLPNLTFDARTSSPLLLEPDGENRIYYAPITIKGHENDLGLTLQYADQDSGEVVESDIIINSSHPFALLEPTGKMKAPMGDTNGTMGDTKDDESGNVAGCSAKYDIASVVTHEIGHFWGLGEDWVDTKATMYYSTPACNIGKRALKTDDVKAVSSLYAEAVSSSSNANGTSNATHCAVTSVGRTSTSGAALLGIMLALAATARRRRR